MKPLKKDQRKKDEALLKNLMSQVENHTKPIAHTKLGRVAIDAKVARHTGIVSLRMDKMLEILEDSTDYNGEEKAKFFFVLSYPLTSNQRIKKEIEQAGKVTCNKKGQITKFVGNSGVRFEGAPKKGRDMHRGQHQKRRKIDRRCNNRLPSKIPRKIANDDAPKMDIKVKEVGRGIGGSDRDGSDDSDMDTDTMDLDIGEKSVPHARNGRNTSPSYTLSESSDEEEDVPDSDVGEMGPHARNGKNTSPSYTLSELSDEEEDVPDSDVDEMGLVENREQSGLPHRVEEQNFDHDFEQDFEYAQDGGAFTPDGEEMGFVPNRAQSVSPIRNDARQLGPRGAVELDEDAVFRVVELSVEQRNNRNSYYDFINLLCSVMNFLSDSQPGNLKFLKLALSIHEAWRNRSKALEFLRKEELLFLFRNSLSFTIGYEHFEGEHFVSTRDFLQVVRPDNTEDAPFIGPQLIQIVDKAMNRIEENQRTSITGIKMFVKQFRNFLCNGVTIDGNIDEPIEDDNQELLPVQNEGRLNPAPQVPEEVPEEARAQVPEEARASTPRDQQEENGEQNLAADPIPAEGAEENEPLKPEATNFLENNALALWPVDPRIEQNRTICREFLIIIATLSGKISNWLSSNGEYCKDFIKLLSKIEDFLASKLPEQDIQTKDVFLDLVRRTCENAVKPLKTNKRLILSSRFLIHFDMKEVPVMGNQLARIVDETLNVVCESSVMSADAILKIFSEFVTRYTGVSF